MNWGRAFWLACGRPVRRSIRRIAPPRFMTHPHAFSFTARGSRGRRHNPAHSNLASSRYARHDLSKQAVGEQSREALDKVSALAHSSQPRQPAFNQVAAVVVSCLLGSCRQHGAWRFPQCSGRTRSNRQSYNSRTAARLARAETRLHSFPADVSRQSAGH